MSTYILKGIDLISLMALTGFQPENHSPAWKAVNGFNIPEAEENSSPLNRLIANGMAGPGGNGKLCPSKEAVMLMKIICSPSQVTGIRRVGISGNTEYSLLKFGSLYCIYFAIPDQDLHICQFPLDEQLVEEWLNTDILVHLPPADAQKASVTLMVSPAECAVLHCIQAWYAKKAEEKVPIEERDLWFTARELNDAFDEAALSKRLEAIYIPEKIQTLVNHLKPLERQEKHLEAMVEAKLLQSKSQRGTEYYCYSNFMQRFMDPLLLRDILMIEKIYPRHKVSVAYLKTDGIFVMHANESTVSFDAVGIEELKRMAV